MDFVDRKFDRLQKNRHRKLVFNQSRRSLLINTQQKLRFLLADNKILPSPSRPTALDQKLFHDRKILVQYITGIATFQQC